MQTINNFIKTLKKFIGTTKSGLFLLRGCEFLLSKWLPSEAKGDGCLSPAEWPGTEVLKYSSGRELVRSTLLSDSTPEKVLRDIGDETITLQQPTKKRVKYAEHKVRRKYVNFN